MNDTYDHRMGNDSLRQVADRLRATLRACDTATRFGGDECAVLQRVMTEPAEASALAAKLVRTLSAIYQIADRQIAISTSTGIALARPGIVDPGDLLEQADAVLYDAKRNGKDTFRFASLVSSGWERRWLSRPDQLEGVQECPAEAYDPVK